MKKGAFLYFVVFLLLINLSYATIPDADQDGVPDADDKCPVSLLKFGIFSGAYFLKVFRGFR